MSSSAGECECALAVPPALELVRELGMDSQYAEVSLWACRACGSPWLRYFYENEAFSRSGRWYVGMIAREEAARMTAARGRATIESLEGYVFGGSYFDGRTGRSSGPIHL
jgi:hypothetical protein